MATLTRISAPRSKITRLVYVIQFLILSILGWVLGRYSDDFQRFIPVLRDVSDSLSGISAIYRLVFALVIYHAVLAIAFVGVKTSTDTRASLQNGMWWLKLPILIALIVIFFFIPNIILQIIGWVSLFGALVFVLIQVVLLVHFAHSWNNTWVARAHEEGRIWMFGLFAAFFILYGIFISLTVVGYVYWTRGDGCSVNTFFITFNIILVIAASVLSVSHRVQQANEQSGILQSGMVAAYSTYLVLSALLSEPDSWPCSVTSGLFTNAQLQTAVFIIGAVFTVISVVYSAFSASTNSAAFDTSAAPLVPDAERGATDDEAGGVSYNYSFFHLTFMFAAMYVVMLLTNWNVVDKDESGSYLTNTGVASTWVQIVSSWLTLLLYKWTLVAPIACPNRDFTM